MIDQLVVKGGRRYEDDIPAEEEIQIQGSWFQSKNEHCQRKKGACFQKS